MIRDHRVYSFRISKYNLETGGSSKETVSVSVGAPNLEIATAFVELNFKHSSPEILSVRSMPIDYFLELKV
jgi:hypothetical protein